MFNDDVPPLERIYQGSRMNFLVLGRTDVRTVTPHVPYIVISVTDPDKPDADIAESPGRRAILRLKFDDAAGTIDVPGLEGLILNNAVELTAPEARTILEFVQTHSAEVKLVLCQCEAGVSRSAAIAAALSRILQGEDDYFF